MSCCLFVTVFYEFFVMNYSQGFIKLSISETNFINQKRKFQDGIVMEFSWIIASLFMKTVQAVLQGVFMNEQLIGAPRDGTVVFFIGFQKRHEIPFLFITQSAQYF